MLWYFLTAQCDPSEAFDLIEDAFELMTLFVELAVDFWARGACRVGLDLCWRMELRPIFRVGRFNL